MDNLFDRIEAIFDDEKDRLKRVFVNPQPVVQQMLTSILETKVGDEAVCR